MIKIDLLKNHPHAIPMLATIWHEVLGKNLVSMEPILPNKNWIGLNQDEDEESSLNSPSVIHFLIKNCAVEEFSEAVKDETC